MNTNRNQTNVCERLRMPMRIFLVSTNTAVSPYPVYPLGCSVVAEALTRAGHDVRVFDCFMESEECGGVDEMLLKFDREIRGFDPSLIGVSIRNIDNVNALEEEIFLDIPKRIVEISKQTLPNVPTVLGGSGYSIMPEEMLSAIGADYGVAGEGERASVELAAVLERGEKPKEKIIGHPGSGLANQIAPLQDGNILGAEYFPELAKLYNAAGCVMPVQTKRGCSNHCVYCTYPLLEGRELRCRPPKEVVADMVKLHDEHGADMIFFTDSVFNDAGGEYLKIVEAIESAKLDIPWTAFFQPDALLTGELVDRLIAAGLHSVELGPDATTDVTLKAIGKTFNFDDVVRCNELFASRNIAVANYFMMGVPAETEETAKAGVENIRKLDMSVSFVFLGVRILPGTPLHRIAVNEGIISPDTPMLDPVYYFSPELERKWLEEYLEQTLSRIKHCVYPPNSMDSGIRILRQMGYRGNLWEMMVRDSRRLPKEKTLNSNN